MGKYQFFSDDKEILIKLAKEIYKEIRKHEYYKNHENHLLRVAKYRELHKNLINNKRVVYYWINLVKSRES